MMLTKRLILTIVAHLLVLVVVSLLDRSKGPQRDYFAEYEGLRLAQWGEHQGAAADATEAWQTVVALDRNAQIERIAAEAIERAFERLDLDEASLKYYSKDDLARHIRFSRRPLTRPLFREDEPEYELVSRAIEIARPIADLGIRDLHQSADVRRAIDNANKHDIVLLEPVPSPTLIERTNQYLLDARSLIWADASMVRAGTDPQQRLESFRAGLLATRTAASDPTMINGLVFWAGESLLCVEVIDAFASPSRSEGLNPEHWLEEMAKHQRMRPNGSWFMEGERLMALDALDAEYTKRPGAIRMNALASMPVIGVSHGKAHQFIDGIYTKIIVSAGEHPGSRSLKEWEDLDSVLRDVDFRLRPLADALVSSFGGQFRNMDRAEAHLNAARIVIALAAYRADHHGASPDTLDALMPEYLDAVPMDPFAAPGMPLIYRLSEDGSPLLYSVGLNGQDDGGTQHEDHRVPQEPGDLVFLPRP